MFNSAFTVNSWLTNMTSIFAVLGILSSYIILYCIVWGISLMRYKYLVILI